MCAIDCPLAADSRTSDSDRVADASLPTYPSDMSTELLALAYAIEQARQLLLAHGDDGIATRLSALEARLKEGDQSAISSALSEATGSMGSLNDRILSRTNGDTIDFGQADTVNRRLSVLVREIEAKARGAAAAYGIPLIR